MKNVSLLFNSIPEHKFIKIKNKNSKIRIKITGNDFNSYSLFEISIKLKYLLCNYKYLPLNIELDLGDVIFIDKATYIILDAIIFYVLTQTNFNISLCMNCDSTRFIHNGLTLTSFIRNSNIDGLINKKGLISDYLKRKHINTSHFRVFMCRSEMGSNDTVSFLMSDVASFLKPFLDDNDYIDLISEVVAELVDNVVCHSDGDCIIDIDISQLTKKDIENTDYKGVNVTIFNISNFKLGDQVKENIINKKYLENDPLYSKVYTAYNNHKLFFDNTYEIDDFFNITTFQRYVSSRLLKSGNGGTGLTTLIEQIIGNSEDHYSYVISGKNIIMFNQDYLNITDEGFVGFNKERDFINARPDVNAVSAKELTYGNQIRSLI